MSFERQKEILIGFFCLVVIVGIYGIVSRLGRDAISPVYTIPRQIQYGFTLKNTSNRIIPVAELWAYGPTAQTATQKCISITASHQCEIKKDTLGNQIVHFVFKNFPPFATKIVRIEADLLLSETPNKLSDDRNEIFLVSEKYIEANHPLILKLSEQLHKRDKQQTVYSVFDWVTQNISYAGYTSRDRGALYALQHKKGDCTEFAYLFTALARAEKIHSRVVGGYMCSKNMVLSSKNYHNWAEYLVAGSWNIADPQNKVIGKNASKYIAMKIMGHTENPMMEKHRYRFEGKGLNVRMN